MNGVGDEHDRGAHEQAIWDGPMAMLWVHWTWLVLTYWVHDGSSLGLAYSVLIISDKKKKKKKETWMLMKMVMEYDGLLSSCKRNGR